LVRLRVLVVQTSCIVNNTRIINLVNSSLEKLNIFNADVFEINYFDVINWDSNFSIVISPAPVNIELNSQVLIIPTAYAGLMSQEEFDAKFRESIKNIVSVSRLDS